MTVRVAVVVLNWNGAGHLEPCLSSVDRQEGHDLDLWVYDNGSTDDSWRDVGPPRHPRFGLRRWPRNLGFAGGCNRALTERDARFVLLVNNDTELEPGVTEQLVETLEADPTLGSATPRLLFHGNPSMINAAGLELRQDGSPASRGRGQEDGPAFDRPMEVFGGHGACLLLRTAALADVGTFDPDFFAYHEEFDLAWRLRLRGWGSAYVPGARVLHREGVSLRRTPDRMLFLMERNRWWLLFKNAGPRFLRRAVTALVASEVAMVRHVVGLRTLVPLRARVAAWLQLGRFWPRRRWIQSTRIVDDEQISQWVS